MTATTAKLSNYEMQALFDRAWKAGQKAAAECTPTPMVVSQHINPLDDHSPVVFRDVVYDGVCGFAWVTVKGRSRFANWLKKNGLGRPGYYGGVQINIRDYGQSMERKEAHAYAMARVLNEAGIEAYADSRMD